MLNPLTQPLNIKGFGTMARTVIKRLSKEKKSKQAKVSRLRRSSTKSLSRLKTVNDPKYLVFFDWLKENGVISSKIEMRQVSENNRVMVCTKEIRKGETFIHVPKNMLITPELARSQGLGKLLNEKMPGDRSFDVDLLTLFILEERKNPASFWKPYLDILPSEDSYSSMPVNYSALELQHLKGTELFRNIVSTRHRYAARYQELIKLVPEISEYTQQEYNSAKVIVTTRTFGFNMKKSATSKNNSRKVKSGDSMCLAPMADMLNHQNPRLSNWRYSHKSAGFQFRSQALMEKHTEVTTSYGHTKSPVEMLMTYGFLPDDEQYSMCFNPRRLIDELVSRNEEKKELISFREAKRKKIQDAKADTLRISHKYNISAKELFSELRFYLLNSEDEVNNATPRKVTSNSVKEEFEMLDLLSALCYEALADYETSLNDDLESLRNSDLTYNKKNITRVLFNEKRILHFFISWADACKAFFWMQESDLVHIVEENRECADLFVGYINEVVLPLMRKIKAKPLSLVQDSGTENQNHAENQVTELIPEDTKPENE